MRYDEWSPAVFCLLGSNHRWNRGFDGSFQSVSPVLTKFLRKLLKRG